MGNRNGTVFFALFALAAAIAIGAGTQARANGWQGHPNVAHGQPSPYPTTNGESWSWNYTAAQASKPAGAPHELLTKTSGTIAESYSQGSKEYSNTLTYAQSVQNSKVVVFGTTTTNDFVAYNTCGSFTCFDLFEEDVSGSFSNSNGGSGSTSATQQYDVNGNKILDELDPVNGQEEGKGTSWNDAVGFNYFASSSTTDVHGNTTTTEGDNFRNPDGTYSASTNETSIFGQINTNSAQTAGGEGDKTVTGGNNPGTTDWGVPIQQNGNEVIPVTTSSGTTFVPDWYPGGGKPPPLWTDVTTDLGATTVPNNCGADAGDIAERLAERSTFLDVIAGTYTQATENRYVVTGNGVVCIVRTRLVDTYDNLVTGALTNQQRFYSLQSLTGYSPAKWQPKTKTIRGFSVR